MRLPSIFLGLGAFSLFGTGAAGCYPHHHHPDPVMDACLIGACVGATYLGPRTHPAVAVAAGATAAALYLAVESGHHHGHRCGCPTRWYSGYRAYYWGGHWEYYDGGHWCVIEGSPGPGW